MKEIKVQPDVFEKLRRKPEFLDCESRLVCQVAEGAKAIVSIDGVAKFTVERGDVVKKEGRNSLPASVRFHGGRQLQRTEEGEV